MSQRLMMAQDFNYGYKATYVVERDGRVVLTKDMELTL
jgi:hypothetical protein